MSTSTVERTVFSCDVDAFKVEAEGPDELPPGWSRFDGREYHSLDCLARAIRERGPIELGVKTAGTGNAKLRTLDEVLSIDSRAWEHVVGCTSCGGKRGQHKVGCSIHR